MCKTNDITFFSRLKFLFTGNIKDVKTKGYYLTWNRHSISKKLKNKVFQRDHYTCHYCKHPFPVAMLTVDHYIPYSVVKEHHIDNLVSACKECNTAKANINPVDPADSERWTRFLKRKIKPRKVYKINLKPLVETMEKQFVRKEITLEEFINKTLDIYTKNKSEINQITFRRQTNNFLKKRYKELWMLNNAGVFKLNTLGQYLINSNKIKLVA